MLGDTGQVVWVTDAAGDDALEIAPVDGTSLEGARGEGAGKPGSFGSPKVLSGT